MVAGLPEEASAVINADDAFAELWSSSTRARVVTFGMRERADFAARDVQADIDAAGFRTRFTLACTLGTTTIELRLAGRHNIANALGAAAAASAAGASLDAMAAGLASMRAVQGRLQLKRARSGAWVIDDSYNANPSSVHAGIEVLAELSGRKWIVLGDMAELGVFARDAHAEVGRFARAHGIERFFATGELAALAVESFGAGGQWYPDTDALARVLDAEATPDVRMLVKGSRVNRLERVIDALLVARRPPAGS